MFELILHHNYKDGSATDISGCNNHGRLSGPTVAEGRNPDANALYFNGTNNRVSVSPSLTLGELISIRASAWIWVEELGQRRNVIEGFLSFALFMEADASLRAGLYDGTRWHSLLSTPKTIPLQEWIHIKFIYDGVDSSLLYVNNNLVAFRHGYLGRVQGVQWPFGLSIGAWPDADKYIFKGKITEVKLWRYLTTTSPND